MEREGRGLRSGRALGWWGRILERKGYQRSSTWSAGKGPSTAGGIKKRERVLGE